MNVKSERLRKLEAEFEDLNKWMHLGLVPKSDQKKHVEEIKLIEDKIKEERKRLLFMKESGDVEEYIAPKRGQKQAYQEPQTLPDMDVGLDNLTEGGIDVEAETFDLDTSSGEEKEKTTHVEDDEDPFSDKNRWKRGIMEDPDVDNW